MRKDLVGRPLRLVATAVSGILVVAIVTPQYLMWDGSAVDWLFGVIEGALTVGLFAWIWLSAREPR